MSALPLPPDLMATQSGIDRKRAIAQALLQSGMTPRQGQMVSGYYVAPGLAGGISQIAQALGGMAMGSQLDKQQADLGQAYNTRLKEGLEGFMRTRDGTPARSMTPDEETDYYLTGDQPKDLQGVKADPRRAVLEAMTSGLPPLQQIGQMELQAMLKPKGGGLEVKDLLPYANPESIPQLLAQGPEAFRPKAGKLDVQDVSIGNGQWQSFEVGPDGRVDMRRPIGQPFSKRPTASDISLTNGDGVPKALTKAQPEIFKETRGQAQSAIRQIQTSDRIERLAQDPQIVAGALARPELLLQSIGSKLGFTGPEAATKTQAMMRELAQATLANVKQLPGPLSEKELPFLEAASAGQIEFTPDAILRIARLQKAAAHNALMDAYSVYKSNVGLAGGEAYQKAYPLPRQGAYQLDPSIYDVDEGNMATLRDTPAAAPAGNKPMPAAEYIRMKKGRQ